MSTHQYSFAEQDFNWNGLDLADGAATDGWTEARAAGKTSRVAHANGNTTLNVETNKIGTISLVVAPGTKLESQLVALRDAETVVVKDGSARDRSTGRIMTYRNMTIESGGDESRGAPARGNTTFVFSFERKETQEPAEIANVIG